LNQELKVTSVLGINVNETSYTNATNQIRCWAQLGESRAIYATSMHGTMEAYDSREFKAILNRADLLTPDGMPLVWMMRLKGVKKQQRTYGPVLMLRVLEMAAREKILVGFYGGEPEVLEILVSRMRAMYPGLRIEYAFSPPFRSLAEEETEQIRQAIISSGVRILFVGLGCPRQERWIDEQRGRIAAVMIGVGAAFDFHAGVKPQAPAWMQKSGLEWLFRLITEPRRLWRRYLQNIPRFIVLAIADLLRFSKRTA
jgi:N-acetylglucosaminyldiphosphoundecaprenol N-acetyl-beta-D-mannosaminyltransferase